MSNSINIVNNCYTINRALFTANLIDCERYNENRAEIERVHLDAMKTHDLSELKLLHDVMQTMEKGKN